MHPNDDSVGTPAEAVASSTCGCGLPDALDAAGDGAPDVTTDPVGPPPSRCEPCVGQLVSQADRTAAIQSVMVSETEPLVTLTHLLRWCRDDHQQLQPLAESPRIQAEVSEALQPLRAAMDAEGGAPDLGVRVRVELARSMAATDLPVVAIAHQAAQLLDHYYAHSFDASFRRRSPYQPGLGDPIPLDTPDLPRLTTLTPTAPPWRLARRLDETRHVRLAGEWAAEFRVIFDYSLLGVLPKVLSRDTVLATVHPNRSLSEFDFPTSPDSRAFPIRPADEARQLGEIDRLLASAVRARASIVVLPELAVTPSMSDALQTWVTRPDGPALLVGGSCHYNDPDGRRRNRSMCWVRGRPDPVVHDKFSAADRPVREDIEPEAHPEIRVYVTADRCHLVIVICRDLLNPAAVHALSEVGANLVLVPAMSETLTAFGGAAAQLVGSCQAVVAVANNPAEWSQGHARAARPARALFGHPGFGQQIRLVNAPDPSPGIATMRLDTGQIGWHPAIPPPLDPATHGGRARQSAPAPAWLLPAVDENPAGASHVHPREPVQLQQSAVLVLLADGPDGPKVLLSERAGDLRDYPGQLVFPGGSLDEDDAGPREAALREAHEEVGLVQDTIQVLAELPAIALPETGFLVTPVLAWSESPSFGDTGNLAEVASAQFVPLSSLARVAPPTSKHPTADDDPWAEGIARARLGRLTRTVIDVICSWLPCGVTGGPPAATTERAATPAWVPASPPVPRLQFDGRRLPGPVGPPSPVRRRKHENLGNA